MSNIIEPEVYCIGETRKNEDEIKRYLQDIGAPNWAVNAPSEVEEIIEIEGRLCYLSFSNDGTFLNSNISKVREGNDIYIKNIVDSKHGSVIEHGYANFILRNISRVFTHELARNDTGATLTGRPAISQESLRFVRLDNLNYWIPSCFKFKEAEFLFEEAFLHCEDSYQELIMLAGFKENNIDLLPISKIFYPNVLKEGIDLFNKLPFNKKKEYTSAARRIIPMGIATSMGWSCNLRALRNIIETRTESHAEEEIRLVFSKLGDIAIKRWPNLFSDYTTEEINGIKWFKTENKKI